MGGIVGRAELLCPPAGQGLALIAAGEEGELAWVGLPDLAEPVDRCGERVVPGNRLELAGAAWADAPERRRQPRRRVVVHDPCRSLGAQHALVDRMRSVALDVADAAVAQVHVDPAAAGTHVAGRLLHLVA